MKLIKCSNPDCQIVQTAVTECRYCKAPAPVEVGAVSIHERVRDVYTDAYGLISNGKFSEAIAALTLAQEWTPTESGIYFYRLLAKNKCSSETDLFSRGLDLLGNNDMDFLLAKKYAKQSQSKDELAFYRRLEEIVRSIQEEIEETEKKAHLHTLHAIKRKLSGLRSQFDATRNELYQLEIELRKTELLIYNLTDKIKCVFSDNQTNQENNERLNQMLEGMRKEIGKMEVRYMNPLNVHVYYVRMTAAIQISQMLLSEAEDVCKNHPWLARIRELHSKQAELSQEIREKDETLNAQQKRLDELLAEYQAEQEAYEQQMQALNRGLFCSGRRVVDDDAFRSIVARKSGLAVSKVKLIKEAR